MIKDSPSAGELFFAFLKLGAVSFGGPAIVASIRRMVVDQKQWLDEENFADGNALCQAVPGAISVQMAIYVGLKLQGLRGATASFAGFIFAPFLFMLILSALYSRMHGLPLVASAFNGLRVIIIAILAHAAVSFARTYLKQWGSILIALSSACLFGLKLTPALVILLAGLAGLLLPSKNSCPRGLRQFSLKNNPPQQLQLLFLFAGVALWFISLYFLDRSLFTLGLLMFKIDLFAFGGGYTSVPLMFHEIVEVRSWMDSRTLLDGIALGQLTPGPIVLTAAFVGYMLKGFIGGTIATICIFLPSFLIVIGITPYFDMLKALPNFNKILEGILCSFAGLLLVAVILFGMPMHWDVKHALVAGAAFTALLFNVEFFRVVIAGAVVSALFL